MPRAKIEGLRQFSAAFSHFRRITLNPAVNRGSDRHSLPRSAKASPAHGKVPLRRLPAAGREVRRTQKLSEQAPPLAINPNSDQYRKSVCSCWTSGWPPSPARPRTTGCPMPSLTESGLKITPLDAAVPDQAQALIDQTSQLLLRIKITELLMDVDDWTGFSRHFTHLKDGAEAKDRTLLLSAILGDAINLGLTKMAESRPRPDLRQAVWLQAGIRDETYSAALAELVNHQYRHAFAAHWGDGTTSSSDGQRFARVAGRSTGHVSPKYGSEAGTAVLYPYLRPVRAVQHPRGECRRPRFHLCCSTACCTTSPTCGSRSTTPTRPASPITSFALMHLLGFRFAPRIRDLGENQAVRAAGRANLPTLRPLIGGTLNIKHVRAHWDDILRPPARSNGAPSPPR